MKNLELSWSIERGDIISNIQKVKEDVNKEIEPYKNYKVEDETVVDDAKDVRQKLNKIKKLIDDEKKRIKNNFMAPYLEIEKDIKEIIGSITSASSHIDKQIKQYEALWKSDKRKEIEEFFESLNFNLVTLDQLFEPSWLNKTTSEKKWKSELKEKIYDIKTDIDDLGEYCLGRYEDGAHTELTVEYLNNGFNKEKAIERYDYKLTFSQEEGIAPKIKEQDKYFVYEVFIDNEEDAQVFESLCEEYNFKIKEKK